MVAVTVVVVVAVGWRQICVTATALVINALTHTCWHAGRLAGWQAGWQVRFDNIFARQVRHSSTYDTTTQHTHTHIV